MNANEQRFNLSKLSTSDFIDELTQRLYQEDEKSAKVNDRAVDLETALYALLGYSKGGRPLLKQYRRIEEILRPLQPQLRNPALYNAACKHAQVAGSLYVKDDHANTKPAEN